MDEVDAFIARLQADLLAREQREPAEARRRPTGAAPVARHIGTGGPTDAGASLIDGAAP